MVTAMRSKLRTWHFWASLLTYAGAMAAAATGHLSREWAALVAGLAAAFYAVARGAAKRAAGKGPKAFVRMTEAWGVLLAAIPAGAAAAAGYLEGQWAALAAAVGALGLAAGVGIRKTGEDGEG